MYLLFTLIGAGCAYYSVSLFTRMVGAGHSASVTLGAVAAVVLVGLRLNRHRKAIQARCPEGKGLYPECMFRIERVGDVLRVTEPDGSSMSVGLDKLMRVVIATNDSGPWGADVWWQITYGPDNEVCQYPQGATGEKVAFSAFQALPGFDDSKVIEAMGSTSNRTFVCWDCANVIGGNS